MSATQAKAVSQSGRLTKPLVDRQRIIWCEQMDAVLREGYASHTPLYLVADHIGVSVGNLHKRIKELGLTRGPKPMKDRGKRPAAESKELLFADLLAEGYDARTAGDMLGYAHGNSVLQRIRAKLGPQAV